MPNWCMNGLTISHSDHEKVQEFADAYNSGKTCEHYIPCPENKDWYDWNISNWGTKWDFGAESEHDRVVVDDGKVIVGFNTAWSPPIDFYAHLRKLGYRVEASYFEPGMAFCGKWIDGLDAYVDYGEDHNDIPSDLWDEFAMAEFFEEFD